MYNFNFFKTFDYKIANIYDNELDTKYLVYFNEDLSLIIDPIGDRLYKNIIVIFVGDYYKAVTKYAIVKSLLIHLSDGMSGENGRDISTTEFRSTMKVSSQGKLVLKEDLLLKYQVDDVSTLITTPEVVFKNLYGLCNLSSTIIKCLDFKKTTHYNVSEELGYNIVSLYGNFFKAYHDYLIYEMGVTIPDILFEQTLKNNLPEINLTDETISGEFILCYTMKEGIHFKKEEPRDNIRYVEGTTDLFNFNDI